MKKKVILISASVVALLTTTSLVIQYFFPALYKTSAVHKQESIKAKATTSISTEIPRPDDSFTRTNLPSGKIPLPDKYTSDGYTDKSFPFCGETDTIEGYDKPNGQVVFTIPSCYQIQTTLEDTNLLSYHVLSESDSWLQLEIRSDDQIEQARHDSKIFDTDTPPLTPAPFWIKKESAFTAWTIKEGNTLFLLQSFFPTVKRSADGNWISSTNPPCETSDTPTEGNNSTENGLHMNIDYIPDRDCGT